MRISVLYLSLMLAAVTPPAISQQDAEPTNAFWQNEYCINPRVPYIVRRAPTEGEVSVLFDISATGKPKNSRIISAKAANGEERFASAFARSVQSVLKRWEYFAYINEGIEAPRIDVPLRFSFVEHGTDLDALDAEQRCVTSLLPEPPSHAGDPKDPMVNLARCQPPSMPARADKKKTSSQVTVTFDITKKGKLSNISLAPDQSEDDFSKEVLRALKKWRYTPFMKAGKPVERTNLAMDFTFGDQDERQDQVACNHAAFGSSRKLGGIGTSKRCEIRFNDGVPVPSKACYQKN